jgi:hypothetical protein
MLYVSLNDWKKIANHVEYCGSPSKLRIDQALQYFPDDYNECLFVFGVPNDYEDKANKWYSDYKELMEHIKNPNYGRTKYSRCSLSPDGEDSIYIGIKGLVLKGLTLFQNTTNNIAITVQPLYSIPSYNSRIIQDSESSDAFKMEKEEIPSHSNTLVSDVPLVIVVAASQRDISQILQRGCLHIMS